MPTWYFAGPERIRAPIVSAVTSVIGIVINNFGSVITSGVWQDVDIPFDCTIVANTLLADQTGTIAVDIWKVPYGSFPPTAANTIVANATPTISNAISSQDNTLTGWITTVHAGDTLRFNVSTAVSVTRLSVALTVTRAP